MPSDPSGQVALVTGGGRGIGENVARELAAAGMRVAVSARTEEQVRATAEEVDGLAVVADVSRQDDVERMVETVERELGPIDLLVNNAGVGDTWTPPWEQDPAEWWRVFEINVLGVYLCTRAVLRGMVERRAGRVVNLGSGASYLPMSRAVSTAYGPSKAALHRFTELLAGAMREHGVGIFEVAPGLVRTEMTASFPDDAPWTPPELAPRLIRAIAEGRLDGLEGRYLHAEHDPLDELERRAAEIVEQDLNALRLRR
ncbi:MAG TPA: SDR family oxidoreductase [Gaiellaceae bacterium]|nr:SDR family oxidoreductase [Gaiellaceae bacterium]